MLDLVVSIALFLPQEVPPAPEADEPEFVSQVPSCPQ